MEKKQIRIFVVIAFVLPYLMGILMGIGYGKGMDLSMFPNAQMFYPAAGVMLAVLLTRKNDTLIPRGFFGIFLGITVVMFAAAIGSIVLPGNGWLMAANLVITFGSVAAWIVFLTTKKEKKIAYGLKAGRGGKSFVCMVLFVAVYLARFVTAYLLGGESQTLLETASNPMTWIMLAVLPVNFFLVFLPFLGEEYGWRFFLQPILQKRFGVKKGIFLLGVVWGLWHLPINFFYYSSPSNGVLSVLGQIITCVTLGIFFGWAYMRTDNIWVPTVLHYLNNNLIPVVTGEYSADVLQGQEVTWAALGVNLVIGFLFFGWPVLTKIFKNQENRLLTVNERAEQKCREDCSERKENE